MSKEYEKKEMKKELPKLKKGLEKASMEKPDSKKLGIRDKEMGKKSKGKK